MGFWATSADAQTVRARGYEPVEQTVADTDPLAVNMRRVEAGLQQQGGQSSSVFRRAGADNDKLYYVAPGIVAEYDRSSYMWFRVTKKRWKLYQLIPPNTVFHLGLPPPEPQPLPPNALRTHRMVDARPTSAPRADSDLEPLAAQWARYRAFHRTQHRALLDAIDAPQPQ